MRRLLLLARWPAAAALLSSLPCLAVLATGHALQWRDTAQQTGPLRPQIVASLRALHLPGWLPWEGTGQPLFASYLHGILHPVSLLAAALAPAPDLLLVLLVGFAGAGAWMAARALSASRGAALGGALAYGLSGFVLGMTSNTQYLMGAASGPWAVTGLLLSARFPRGWVAGAAGCATLALSGDPGALAAFTLAGVVLAGAERFAGTPRALACVALGLGLAAVQLIPFALAFADTARGAGYLSAEDRLRWAFAPWRLLELAAPGFFVGRPASYVAPVFQALDGATHDIFPFAPSVAIGSVALLLAAIGARNDRRARVLAGLALVFTWMALGHRAGALQALSWVPVWGSLRYWEKLVAPLTLCLALGAARGIDALRVRERMPGGDVALAAGGAGLVLLLLTLPASRALFPADVAALARTRLLVGGAHACAGLLLLAGVLRLPRFEIPGAVALLALQGLAASPFALHPGNRATLGTPPPRLQAAPPGARMASPLACDVRATAHDLDAIDLLARCERRMGRASTNAAWQVDSFPTYSALAPRRWESVFAAGPLFWPLARRFGTTHVLSRPPSTPEEETVLAPAIAGATGPRVLDGGSLLVWELPHRAWAGFAPSLRPVAGPEEAAAALGEEVAAGSARVIVESSGSFPVSSGRVLHVDRGADALTLEAESAGDGVLVVNDAWAPGWRAWVDGRETAVLPADLLVRAVRWPAGRHRLEMRYTPPGLWAGAAITLFSILLGAGVWIWQGRCVQSAR